MSGKNWSSSSAAVIIEGTVTNGNSNGEKVETIDVPVETIFHLQRSDNAATGGGDDATPNMDIINSEIQYINVGEIIENTQAEAESSPAETYLFNAETGELQLINLSEATTIDGNEVEIVTVDGNNIFTDFQSSSNTFQVFDGGFSSEHLHSNERSKKIQISSKSESSGLRTKSGPALLRNSRRVINAEHAGGGNTTGGEIHRRRKSSSGSVNIKLINETSSNQSSSIKPSSRKPKTCSATEDRPIVVLSNGSSTIGQIGRILESNHTITVDNSGEAPSGFYIYQNPSGDQVAELFSNSSSSLTHTNNLIYQLDNYNDTVFFSDVKLFNESSTSKVRKRANKSIKKTLKKPVLSNPLKKPKKINKGGGASELKCMENGCLAAAYNVSELRKHLTLSHDLSFDLERREFQSDAAFKEWRQHYERDRMVSFIYRGGTKKVSKDQSVTYMICHRSGHYKPTMEDTAKRKRKMKPQGSCKIGGYCTAGIKLLKNLETGYIMADICHTHYGHPLDSEAIPHLRVNPVLKKLIIKKFEEGLNFADMLAYIHHNPDGLEGLRVVDRRAIRNIYDTWKKINVPKMEDISPQIVCNSADSNVEIQEEEIPMRTNVNILTHQSLESAIKGPTDQPVDNIEEIDYNDEPNNTQNIDDTTNLQAQSNEKVWEISSKDHRLDDESAPILYAVTDKIDECCENSLDEDPPILIAIDSIKSLKPEDEVVSSGALSNSTSKKTSKKGLRNTRTLKDESKPVIMKTESKVCNAGSSSDLLPNSALQSDLESSKKVIPFRKRKASASAEPLLCNKKNNLATQQTVIDVKEKFKTEHEDGLMSPMNSTPSQSELTDDEYFESLQIKISSELETTIDKLHNHGEAGPSILLYKRIGETNTKYGGFCRAFREDDFCLIIQTPVQRQIFQLFPKVVSLEIIDSPKPNEHGLKLVFMSVLDDFREAIPIAWMIADSVCTRFLNQFFRMLRYHCGELPVLYIMAPRSADILKSWTTHFSHKPKMLQSEFTVKRDLRTLLNRHFPNDDVRCTAWKIVESLINEKERENLKVHIKSLEKISKQSITGSAYLRKMEKDWFPRITEWSFVYRVGIKANLLFAADSFVKLRKFVSFKGTKRLNQSIDHILKIGYDKCFLRTKRMFKGDQKLSNMLAKLDQFHALAITSLKDVSITAECPDGHTWNVKSEHGEEQSVEVFQLQSPCDCKIRCKICKICMHEYMCTCEDFLNHQTMCSHIHRVHCALNNISLEGVPQESSPQQERQEVGSNNEIIAIEGLSFEDKSNPIVCSESAGITIINENDIEDLNITEVLGFLGEQADGPEVSKIVSITDVDTQKVLYNRSNEGSLAIFQLDSE